MVPISEWNLEKLDDPYRRDRLLNPRSPNSLLNAVIGDAAKSAADDKIALSWEPSKGYPGFFRIEAAIPISKESFDPLFNGRSGYRAQYYLSPEKGERFNRAIIDGLGSAIREAFLKQPHRLPIEWNTIELSRKGCQSKIWIAGDWAPFVCLPNVLHPPRWAAYWETSADESVGLRAPLPEEPALDLKGTFVNPDTGEVWLNPKKKCRADDIFQTGWI
jgi:hypothetical protein